MMCCCQDFLLNIWFFVVYLGHWMRFAAKQPILMERGSLMALKKGPDFSPDPGITA